MLRAVFWWLKLQHVWHYTKLAKAWNTKATCTEHSNASTIRKHQQCTSAILWGNNKSEILVVFMLKRVMQCIFFLSCRPESCSQNFFHIYSACRWLPTWWLFTTQVAIVSCSCPNASQKRISYVTEVLWILVLFMGPACYKVHSHTWHSWSHKLLDHIVHKNKEEAFKIGTQS